MFCIIRYQHFILKEITKYNDIIHFIKQGKLYEILELNEIHNRKLKLNKNKKFSNNKKFIIKSC